MSTAPYRTQATMPVEELPMDDKTYNLKLLKLILLCIAGVVMTIAGCNVGQTFHNNSTQITLRQLDNAQNVRDTQAARAVEAKALADRAMFELMQKK